MQFLVYLTVLMVSISTVLLEVHWLTSPPPQPKPAVQAAQSANASTQPRKVEGPTAALSPVYPKPAEPTPAAPSGAPQAQPQQTQISSNPAPAPAPAAVAANPEPQKPATETTGVAARADETKESATASAAPVATTSNNRCDVQACSSAYQSFRASDCTYQPFEGARRVCEKAPTQRTAREQTERPERRQWSRERDVTPRYSDRTVGRRVYDDPDEIDADDDDDGPRFSIFRARGPRW
jgi:BA14K-like protein